MRPIELIALITISFCCAGGVFWLFYDINKQIKLFEKAYEESTLGLVEDEEEDRK
jgi:hypothetical protein